MDLDDDDKDDGDCLIVTNVLCLKQNKICAITDLYDQFGLSI
jgi:hypothetical protein